MSPKPETHLTNVQSKPLRVLILGGTFEARNLAAFLFGNNHLDIITSLAGRTEQSEKITGKTRIGGFGGAAGMAKYLMDEDINLLIDATHPFALRISENAREASRITGVALLSFERTEWKKQEKDNWINCRSLEESAKNLPADSTAFLALGRQYLHWFSHRNGVKFIVRTIDRTEFEIPFPNCQRVIGKPSNDVKEEVALFKSHGITHLVCRNSGGVLSYAKVEAARQLGLPVLMILHPRQAKAENRFDDIKELIATITRFSS